MDAAIQRHVDTVWKATVIGLVNEILHSLRIKDVNFSEIDGPDGCTLQGDVGRVVIDRLKTCGVVELFHGNPNHGEACYQANSKLWIRWMPDQIEDDAYVFWSLFE